MSNLSNISYVKEILSRHGFSFSKKLGQNFLINPSVCPKMALESIPDNNFCALEIGPGVGVLTTELAKRAQKVVAIEIDSRLIPLLEETLSEYDNVKVISADVMKLDLNKLIEEEFYGKDVAVCANLPYYITSPIIMKLLEEKLPVKSLTVMVQKEAAIRLCAQPGKRECAAVSFAVRYYSEPKILFSVSAGSFMPAPKVDSAVIQLNIRKEPPIKVENESLFFKVVRGAFLQRRKTVANSLSSALGIAKGDINAMLERVNIPLNSRAEQLTMEEIAALSDELDSVL